MRAFSYREAAVVEMKVDKHMRAGINYITHEKTTDLNLAYS
ncbi:MAG: hypothetical protein ABIH76_06385 [Candidatus Bathyarchaeota archaeon]